MPRLGPVLSGDGPLTTGPSWWVTLDRCARAEPHGVLDVDAHLHPGAATVGVLAPGSAGRRRPPADLVPGDGDGSCHPQTVAAPAVRSGASRRGATRRHGARVGAGGRKWVHPARHCPDTGPTPAHPPPVVWHYSAVHGLPAPRTQRDDGLCHLVRQLDHPWRPDRGGGGGGLRPRTTLDGGVTTFDTADAYATGAAEEVIGSRVPRHPPAVDRAVHQDLLAGGRRSQRPRAVAQAHHGGVPRLAAPARHGLRGPLPGPPLRLRDAARGDAAGL